MKEDALSLLAIGAALSLSTVHEHERRPVLPIKTTAKAKQRKKANRKNKIAKASRRKSR